MIVKRYWVRRKMNGLLHKKYKGLFLFGIIPLYIESSNWY